MTWIPSNSVVTRGWLRAGSPLLLSLATVGKGTFFMEGRVLLEHLPAVPLLLQKWIEFKSPTLSG